MIRDDSRVLVELGDSNRSRTSPTERTLTSELLIQLADWSVGELANWSVGAVVDWVGTRGKLMPDTYSVMTSVSVCHVAL